MVKVVLSRQYRELAYAYSNFRFVKIATNTICIRKASRHYVSSDVQLKCCYLRKPSCRVCNDKVFRRNGSACASSLMMIGRNVCRIPGNGRVSHHCEFGRGRLSWLLAKRICCSLCICRVFRRNVFEDESLKCQVLHSFYLKNENKIT